MRKAISRSWLIASIFAFLLPVALLAQGSATIFGTVTDASGAVVPGVSITVNNVLTGLVRKAATDETGSFVVSQLPIGTYSVSAESKGFKTAIQDKIQVHVEENRRVNFALEVGAVTESITVEAAGAQVDTREGAIKQVIDADRIVELPLNGRNPIELQYLVAGVGRRTGRGQQQNPSVSMNGARTNGNNYTRDGGDNYDPYFNSPSAFPNPDALQEFTIQTNSYAADRGRNAGIIMSAVTKSGTNEFHGTAFEFLRNEKLNARNFFANNVPPFKRNQYGFAAGGPIVRNKVFIFGDYEWTRVRESRTVTTTVPTMQIRAGDFTELTDVIYDPYSYDAATKTRTPFPGNVIPQGVQDPISKEVATWYPTPQIPDLTSNYVFNPPNNSDVDKWDIRADYNIGASDTMYFRFSYQRQFDPASPALPFPAYDSGGNGSDFEHNGRNMALVWNHIWSPNLITSTRLGWNKMFTERLPVVDKSLNAELGIQGVNQVLAGMGTMNINGYQRSEERRVGKECRSRWSPYH